MIKDWYTNDMPSSNTALLSVSVQTESRNIEALEVIKVYCQDRPSRFTVTSFDYALNWGVDTL